MNNQRSPHSRTRTHNTRTRALSHTPCGSPGQEGEGSASEEEGGDQEQDDDFFTIRRPSSSRDRDGGHDGGEPDSEDEDEDGGGVGGGDRSKFSPDLEALEDWEGSGEGCAIEALRNK